MQMQSIITCPICNHAASETMAIKPANISMTANTAAIA